MTHPLKLDIVSDVSCPWCVIGYKSMEKALQRLLPEITAHITWQPFELNPDMPTEGQDIIQHLQEKYGSTEEQIEQNHQLITERGIDLGFVFDFTQTGRIYNTFNAHRLLHWAATQGKQTDLKLALFEIYFSSGGNPSAPEDLLNSVRQAGLSVTEAEAILASDQHADAVRKRIQYYRALGVSSVPTFIINDEYSIVGGHPVETFEKTLREIAS